VQPGLSREPIKELTRLILWSWPVEVALLLVPTGMVSVLNGHIDDGYGGLLGWLWVMSALMTLGLAIAALRALAGAVLLGRSWRQPVCSTWRSSRRLAPMCWLAPYWLASNHPAAPNRSSIQAATSSTVLPSRSTPR